MLGLIPATLGKPRVEYEEGSFQWQEVVINDRCNGMSQQPGSLKGPGAHI